MSGLSLPTPRHRLLASGRDLFADRYDERYHPSNRRWSQSVRIREDIGHRGSFVINGHSAIIDGFVRLFRQEMEQAVKQEQGPSMNEMTM